MKSKLLLFIAVVVFIPLSVVGSENIRVVIADNQKTVTLISLSGLAIKGVLSGGHETKRTYSAASLSGRSVRIRSMGDFIDVNGKSYRGWVELRRKKNGRLLVINELDIEDYLKGVIAAEVPNDWEFEALKAQAVASRTYVIYQKREAGNRSYHILATVNSQVYAGKHGERTNALRADRKSTRLNSSH